MQFVLLLISSIGGLDHYIGEKILFLDEYKGELPYGMLLTICDKYKANIHARYRNIWALWDEVYIASNLFHRRKSCMKSW